MDIGGAERGYRNNVMLSERSAVIVLLSMLFSGLFITSSPKFYLETLTGIWLGIVDWYLAYHSDL